MEKVIEGIDAEESDATNEYCLIGKSNENYGDNSDKGDRGKRKVCQKSASEIKG